MSVDVFVGVFLPSLDRSERARIAVSATDSTPLICTTSVSIPETKTSCTQQNQSEHKSPKKQTKHAKLQGFQYYNASLCSLWCTIFLNTSVFKTICNFLFYIKVHFQFCFPILVFS